ncbi:hypothetical protein [Leptospira bandrabouensis]|uniref:hypothetical protein n=1 Tax=Leptospira bandrabouensis TaxID=2484903 RepID=UPI001EE8F199|nr:hypothetical protein [Leptospira bandrabouensis]MCG6146491.1 hypothetical protein [Leptospira bandrabouensis]MCG6161863.1 hypothetical protein [Leptospira bandrabouensis]MCG6166086.1 hypothetical protein [Leptospira bandrabouensis]
MITINRIAFTFIFCILPLNAEYIDPIPHLNNYESFCAIKKLKKGSLESCNNEELKNVMDYRSDFKLWAPTKEERRLHARNTCKNEELKALFDFHFFLKRRYDLFEFCTNNLENKTEEEKIEQLNKDIFEILKRQTYRKINYDGNNFEIQTLISQLEETRNEILFQLGNSDHYFIRFPILEYEPLLVFNFLEENAFNDELLRQAQSRLRDLKELKFLIIGLNQQSKNSGIANSILETKNHEIAKEISILSEKIQKSKILKEKEKEKIVLIQTAKCIQYLAEQKVSKVSLRNYLGFFKRYSEGEYSSSYLDKKFQSLNFLVNLYHKNTFSGEIFQNRLKFIYEDCSTSKK